MNKNYPHLIIASTMGFMIRSFISNIVRRNPGFENTAMLFDIELGRHETGIVDSKEIDIISNNAIRFIIYAPSSFVYVFTKKVFGKYEEEHIPALNIASEDERTFKLVAHHDSNWRGMIISELEAAAKVATIYDIYEESTIKDYNCHDISSIRDTNCIYNFDVRMGCEELSKYDSDYRFETMQDTVHGKTYSFLTQIPSISKKVDNKCKISPLFTKTF